MGKDNIRNHFKKTLISFLCLLSFSAHSKIHEFETTHLKSMAGAGSGSVLAEESAFLNPAPLAFFATSSVYAQKDTGTITSDGLASTKPKSLGFVLADGNPSLSGSLSYVSQTEDVFTRKRWGLTLSGPISDKSAMGVSVRKSEDNNTQTDISQKYYQAVIGITHAIDETFSIGIVAYDPFKSRGDETKALIGIQYILMSYITTSIDFGGNYYSDNISNALIFKGALQVKVLDDFFLRFGGFNDKARLEKGNGFGLAWIQPRLSFEFAIKNTSREKDLNLAQTESKFKETSLAASIRF